VDDNSDADGAQGWKAQFALGSVRCGC
jgi:hypothetical protein